MERNSTWRSGLDLAALLVRYNDEYTQRCLPNTVVILIFLLVGVLGNGLIIFVYEFRFPRSDGRYYIGPLAFSDLGAIIFTSILNLLQNLMKYVFPGPVVCKLVVYLSYAFISTSLFLWNVIAVQRYRKICKPFSWQMPLKWRRWCVVLCAGLSFTLYSPVLYLFEVNEHVVTENNITVSVCEQTKTNVTGLKIFQGVLFLLSLVNVIAIIWIYVLVSIKIYKVMRGVRQARAESIRSTSNSWAVTTSSVIDNQSLGVANAVGNVHTISRTFSRNSVPQTEAQKLEHKIAFTFMTILCMGLLSYLPSRSLLVYETLNTTFWDNLDYGEFNFYLFLRRIYVVNHSCNIFIYLIFDFMFRKEIATLLRICDP
jgi:hypothetical protein